MTYIADFIINALIATVLAGLASLVAAVLPVRSKRFRTRLVRGAATFAVVWFGIVLYGAVDMFRPHRESLSKTRGAEIVPGLVRSSGQVLRAERVYKADTAQTYILVKITGDEVEAFAKASQMRKDPFNGHTAEARGWRPPDWWSKRPCPAGVTYNDDRSVDPPRHLTYVINWCPSEGKAYVQNFDY